MPGGKILVEGTDALLAEHVHEVVTRRDRRRGLLARPRLMPGEALVLRPARQIHTFGMRYPIDVLFCDSAGAVQHVARDLKPWRVTRWVRRAAVAVELPAGAAAGVLVGDRLRFEHEES